MIIALRLKHKFTGSYYIVKTVKISWKKQINWSKDSKVVGKEQ